MGSIPQPNIFSSDAYDIVKRVRQTARLIMALAPGVSTEPYHESSGSPLPIMLPHPPSLKPLLIKAGAQEELASKLERVYRRHALDLRDRFHTNMEKIWNICSGGPSDREAEKLLSHFAETYMRRMYHTVEEGLQVYKKYAAAAAKKADFPKSMKPHRFNHNYVPLLEHYFEQNHFPSSADRAMLARKSGMTTRQITVWFQNHRNRAKKDGKIIERKTACGMSAVLLDDLVARIPHHINTEYSRSLSPQLHVAYKQGASGAYQSSPSSSSAFIIAHVFDVPAPSHAFPSSYPPQCSYRPFPVKDGFGFSSSLHWYRRSAQSRSVLALHTVSVDELTEKFALLSVREVSWESRRKPQERDKSAAVVAITVIPSCAPHPALVRGSMPVTHRSRLPPLPTIPASTQRRHVFDTPSPQSRPVTLVSQTGQLGSLRLPYRKIAPLPRRAPNNTCRSRATTPAGSPKSWRSRTPSCSPVPPRVAFERGSGSEISNEDVPAPSTPMISVHRSSPLLPQLDMPFHMGNFFDIPSLLDGSSVITEMQNEFDALLAKANFSQEPSFNFPFDLPESVLTCSS